MEQVKIRSVTQALTRSNEAKDGAMQHGAALGIMRNTAVAITFDRNGLGTARDVHEIGKLDLAKKRDLRNGKVLAVRAFARIARDILRPHLGNRYQGAWTAAGFIGTLEIPVTPGKLVVLLETLSAYLKDHPAAENAGLNVTAARAATLAAELLAAENAVNAQVVVVREQIRVRNVKFAALKKRIGDLFKELSQVMTPTDNRWLAFGFKIPGAQATPDQPQNVTATLVDTDKLSVQWDRSARAKYYRVFLKVIGVDADFVQVGTPADLDFLFEKLPAHAQVEIAVTANNSGGESARSAVLLVALPEAERFTEKFLDTNFTNSHELGPVMGC